MRQQYHDTLKKHFRRDLLNTRSDLGLTRDRMAELLSMDSSSLADLESGKYTCSAVTLLLYLFRCCPDSEAFLSDLQKEMDAVARQRGQLPSSK
ncbi:MAG TPA: helix-turn-helix transcriptional regulator [Candidatus Faecousia intestinigallinarum]|nr:helix-turn-helix transcriptional regulator [Candidatus Faecousia intestinigallinarum]